ncbi:SDR family NAD(P)-dependent oxidoreductase [Streptomyces sp. RerS4]|uniref:SDR family NAD(P)-dependent oxidoreductase n=1 Tax=Streptomyces sp. RerS4 TaxID=2942449 RepID=UPI00201BA63A|nr:SDR family NAD(P)-dependent oxidoreductase [Streptomyces sp. RerS4]UQX03776.1 SDR family NAD(P)-dependent oxidoreductase [Streptomyces sp. RerS4]
MNDIRPLAMVTGASSGIGFELARQLAERGFDLVINAEDHDRLRAAARRIRQEAGTSVEAVPADLRRYDEAERFYDTVTATGRPVAVAVLNAGVGQGGAFVDTDLADDLEIVDLNVRSTVHLAKRVLRDMAADGEGHVLVTSSIASTVPGSFQAVYNASKSFLQSFAQALRNELKETGVTVTALMPGPTETDFFRRADMEDTKVGRQDKDDPAQVARQGLDALFAGKDKIVAGSLKTRAQGLVNKVLPDRTKAQAHRRMAEPGSGEGSGDASRVEGRP